MSDVENKRGALADKMDRYADKLDALLAELPESEQWTTDAVTRATDYLRRTAKAIR